MFYDVYVYAETLERFVKWTCEGSKYCTEQECGDQYDWDYHYSGRGPAGRHIPRETLQ